MNHAELLKTAAAEIQSRDAKIAELNSANEKLQGDNVKLAEAVQKQSGLQKVAAELAPLAKEAAALLLDKGLAKSAEHADQIAAQIVNDHASAIRAISKVAAQVPGAQKVGSVVLSTTRPRTADEAWDSAFSARLG